MPLTAGVALLLALARPPILRGPARWLDAALLACLLVVAAQLAPLPAAARDRLSPRAFAVDRVVALDAAPATHPAHALSVDPAATGWALAIAVAYIGIFWGARAVLAGGGVRVTARAIAWLGLALTALVAVQRATAPALLYWTFKPLTVGAQPYGPFVNRNGFASWLAMAVPLVIGYTMARYQSQRRPGGHAVPGESIDATQLWLAASAVLMTGGLLASLSRAGILGAGVGLTVFIVLVRKRIGGARGVAWIVAGLAAMVVVGSAYANLTKLALRLRETTELNDWGRPAIWRDSWHMATDFWLTGVGAGAFQRAMLVYQEGSRLFFFNHAHDEYLQLLAEGGVLLAIPAAVAVLAAAVVMARRLGADRTAIFWVRAGAIAGIVAAAVQGIWDTGLRTPANGVLFAVLAAIAMHDARPPAAARPDSGGRSSAGSRDRHGLREAVPGR